MALGCPPTGQCAALLNLDVWLLWSRAVPTPTLHRAAYQAEDDVFATNASFQASELTAGFDQLVQASSETTGWRHFSKQSSQVSSALVGFLRVGSSGSDVVPSR